MIFEYSLGYGSTGELLIDIREGGCYLIWSGNMAADDFFEIICCHRALLVAL